MKILTTEQKQAINMLLNFKYDGDNVEKLAISDWSDIMTLFSIIESKGYIVSITTNLISIHNDAKFYYERVNLSKFDACVQCIVTFLMSYYAPVTYDD